MANANVVDIVWVAGYLEGEGCFISGGPKKNSVCPSPTIQTVTTDIDVAFKVANILHTRAHILKPLPNRKQVYQIRIHGEKAAAWMMTLFCLMSRRRKDKIKEVIGNWRFGIRPYATSRGHRRRYRNG